MHTKEKALSYRPTNKEKTKTERDVERVRERNRER